MNSYLRPMKTTWLFLMVFPHLILSIVFAQSGIDKLMNWNSNLSWIRGHFANSPLNQASKWLLIMLTGLETLGGVLGLIGVGLALAFDFQGAAATALEFSLLILGLALTGLMIGQRMAKDYAGAANLVGYCLLLGMSFLFITLVQDL